MTIKKVAIQMDPIEKIDLDFDTSFLLAKEAQDRGYEIFYYNPKDLEYKNRSIFALGHFVELFNDKNRYYNYLSSKKEIFNLENADVILIRQDPPFDMNYITSTYLLEKLSSSTTVLNNPSSIRNSSEKIYPLEFEKFMAPTIITQNIVTIKEFLLEHQDIVTKPLYGNGGEGIFRSRIENNKLQGIDESKTNLNEPIIVQKYIPEIIEGDRRIILIDGEYAGSVARIPEKNNLKANFHAGGYPKKTDLVYRDKEIDKISLIGFCFIIGGGIGNIYDRILYGSVTDFLFIDLGGIFKTGIFNIADLSVTTGMIMILLMSFKNK